ncbi:MAG TPA: SRPBCC domain-containing protein [Nitrosopumilaceae archaeon]|nr:SRPBCC domain-containing protein [Nitrosopumilaceae archaeon]
MSEREIKKVVEVDASPEVVFKAITDPNELTNWFPDHAILEPKVGGKFKFSFYKDSKKSISKAKEHRMDFFPEGKVLEFIPNKKVSYTWQHKAVPDFPETVVTWELESIGKNKTRVKLTHSGFAGKEGDMYKEHNEGWSHVINELILYCKEKRNK